MHIITGRDVFNKGIGDFKRSYRGKNPIMIVGYRKNRTASSAIQERSQNSINYALRVIKNSEVAPFVKKLYLYGSCARKQQTYSSDVDLFLELISDFDIEKYKSEIIRLKGAVVPADINMPEVDLKVVIGNSWEENKMLYYKNVKEEGIDIWRIPI